MRLKRSVRINAQGKELCKFINLMHEEYIGCREQYCRGEVFHGDILHRDLARVREIADKCGVMLKTAAYDSVGERLFRYRNRIGIFFGVMIAAFTVIYFSQIVVTVEISGNTSVRDEVILAALAELDVKSGTPVHRLDLQKCADRLPFMVEGIAWAGMHRTGSRIAVQIRETAPIPKKERGRVPCNIVSERDAEITYILARNGSPVRKAGDYVPKGAMLISGVYELSSGKTSVCTAMGEVRGIFSENVSFSAAFHGEELLPCGRSSTRRTLRLFGLDIPLSFGEERFERSTRSCTETPLVLFGKELPVSIRKEKITETVRRRTGFTAEELTDRLMKKVFLYEKNFLGSNTKIISRTIVPEETEDTLTLNVSYKLEGNIGKQQDIFVK